MSPMVNRIAFKSFRGLQNLEIPFKRNLLIYAGNGRGKSSIVQGLEWLFSGEVENIDNTAIRHINAKENEPTAVALFLTNGEGTAMRVLAVDSPITCSKLGANYIEDHPSPDSFILRRAKLLQFMDEKPGERYQRILGLIGLAWLNDEQQAFEDALDILRKRQKKTEDECGKTLTKYIHFSNSESIESASDIFNFCNSVLSKFSLPKIKKIKEIENRLNIIASKRSIENVKLLSQIEGALGRLLEITALDVSETVANLNKTREVVNDLCQGFVDVKVVPVLNAAEKYFLDFKDMSSCPVCERKFDITTSYNSIFESLNRRIKDFSELNNAEMYNEKLTKSLEDELSTKCRLLVSGLSYASFIGEKGDQINISKIERNILEAIGKMRNASRKASGAVFHLPKEFMELESLKLHYINKLKSKKEDITKNSPSEVELAYQVFSSALKDIPILIDLQRRLKKQKYLVTISEKILDAFKKSRKKAFETILLEISSTVKQYYDRVHLDDDRCEYSECSAISLRQDNRGRGKGNIYFETDFFNKILKCEPRLFLSEGHLDSLGLCIYLASVKKFNRPGTLLVLDDVLTSIDKEHRHRVSELIFNEFSDYQIILTTHDDPWFYQLETKIKSNYLDTWSIRRFGHWSLESGPVDRPNNGAYKVLKEAYQHGNLNYFGGPIRILTEDICCKTADALKLAMPYRLSGEYTLPNFSEGRLSVKLKAAIEKIANKMIADISTFGECTPEQKENLEKEKDNLLLSVETVIGCSFMNKLVHKKPNLEDVPHEELKNFVESLIFLYEKCCNNSFLQKLKTL